MKASRMRRPSGVRIGMFCRLGSLRGQPAGDGHRLREAGVHAAGGRVDHARQLVGVGALELGQAAVLEDAAAAAGSPRPVPGSTSSSVLGAPLAVFLSTGRPWLLEEDLADLLGRAEVEGLAGRLMRLASPASSMRCGRAPRTGRVSSAASISTPCALDALRAPRTAGISMVS
jgi:hypothetical protein